MKIAVLSDIHDNIWTLQAALHVVQPADLLICCGDLCSPFVVSILAQSFHKPIHLVFGNNDGDLYRISNNAKRFGHFCIEGEFYKEEIGGKKFAVNHYDSIALQIASGGRHDVVCFGHNHRYQVERFGPTLAINPGTLMGYSPLDNKEVPPTFVLYDSLTDQVESYQIEQPRPGNLKVSAYLPAR